MLLLLRPRQGRVPLLVLLVDPGPVINQQLLHLVARTEMYGHVQAVFPVLALDSVGILAILQEPPGPRMLRHETAQPRGV